jgi:deoxyribodipyrimidine photo-lyase
MSNLSPYLHFGQIAPAYVVNAVYAHLQAHPEKSEAADGFLEELVVRRELAINFVYFNPHYDAFEHMTYGWAYETMAVHIHDEREYTYTRAALEGAKTHDPYWNASMLEMKETGKMHTYMRMYWCKKIMEWSEDYKTAYDTALYLNNKYFLDGRDPCSYTGVAWCFGKHDRAWKERAVFGKLRYMNSNGLRRKFDMAPYVARFNGA